MAIAELELSTGIEVVGINREAFASALTDAMRAVSARSYHPVLGGVRIEAVSDSLTFTGTDLEICISRTIPADVIGAGAVVVNGKSLKGMIAKLGKGATLSLSVADGDFKVTAGKRSFSLTPLTLEDFPEFAGQPGPSIVAGGDDVARAFSASVMAASTDEVRPVLTGVLFHSDSDGLLQLVSTDSYRLGIVPLPCYAQDDLKVEPIIPARALSLFAAWAKSAKQVRIVFGDAQATLTVPGLKMVTRMIEGEFPKYRQLVPDYGPGRLVVDAAELEAGIGFAAAMAGTNTPVRFDVIGDQITLSTTEADVGGATETVSCVNYSGLEVHGAYNPRFLSAAMGFLGSAQVEIQIKDALKPAVLTGNGRTYIAMPVRLSR